VSGLHHVELRPRSLRYYTTERLQRLSRYFGYRICGFTPEVSTGERNVSGSACPRGQRRSTG
jgi:hypothetical protein